MIEIAYAMGTSSPEGSPRGGGLMGMMPLVLVFFIIYFLVIRPQQKQKKEHQKMITNLKKGDRVLTSGGIYGNIVGIKDNLVVLKLTENVKVELAKNAISQVVQ